MTMENGTQVTKALWDKHNLMKQELLEEFQLKYTQMVRFVSTMPLNHAMRMNGFGRADEFFFWIREAINQIQYVEPTPPPAQPETPPAPQAPEEAPEKVSDPAPLE